MLEFCCNIPTCEGCVPEHDEHCQSWYERECNCEELANLEEISQ